MKLDMNELMNHYFNRTKQCISLELESKQLPYTGCDEALEVREEYVTACLQSAMAIWHKCQFGKRLIVVYEDKYSAHEKNEKALIESYLKLAAYKMQHFKWQDEEDQYHGTRYIWHTKYLDAENLFKRIILSDLGEDTSLDCAVYIIDEQTENVFFLYDDRGMDIYSNDNSFIKHFNEYK